MNMQDRGIESVDEPDCRAKMITCRRACTIMEHRLKIMPEFFQAVTDGRKTFELRKDDRGFAVGDRLVLSEWNGSDFTGREFRCVIDYILKDYDGLCPGYAILGIVPDHKST